MLLVAYWPNTDAENHQIFLTMASLQLRTYYFFVSADHDVRQRGLLKAYTTALNLISKAIEANEKSCFFRYAPDGYGHFLVIAAILVMKIIHSSYSRNIDVEEGRVGFSALLQILRSASIEDNDVRGRVGKILTQLWNLHQSRVATSIEEEPKLNIKTRLGASLLHDSLWTWREEFGGQRDATRATATNAVNQTLPVDSKHAPTAISNLIGTGNQEDPDLQPLHHQGLDQNIPTPLEELNFNFDVQDMNWLWDVGFPSFLPMDFNSYESEQSSFQ